jgi:hypothetical protein
MTLSNRAFEINLPLTKYPCVAQKRDIAMTSDDETRGIARKGKEV